MAKVVTLIYTEERRGSGKDDDPVRLVPQLWTFDGRLVCEAEHAINEDLISGHFEERVVFDVLRSI